MGGDLNARNLTWYIFNGAVGSIDITYNLRRSKSGHVGAGLLQPCGQGEHPWASSGANASRPVIGWLFSGLLRRRRRRRARREPAVVPRTPAKAHRVPLRRFCAVQRCSRVGLHSSMKLWFGGLQCLKHGVLLEESCGHWAHPAGSVYKFAQNQADWYRV